MGKILRIGTATNYTLEETSAYDANAPAATRSPWSDSAAMDQEFTEPAFTTVTAEGAVVTFLRLPDIFYGAMVKLRPTYDKSVGEAPAFQLWTHANGAWTLRRNIALANVFVGIPSGVSKVLDLTFFPGLQDVDEVWLTMNPGVVGTPSLEFIAIHLFGQCEASRRQDTSGPTPLCELDPDDPLYTGRDENDVPCPGTTFGPPASNPPPDLDLCNPVSIQQYRDFIADIPGFLDIFDAWLASNGANIAQFCSGITNDPPTPPSPPGFPPALPPLDVCDQTSVDAFRAAVSGDAQHLADFNAYMDGLAESGFLDLVCPQAEPDDVYLDPVTLDPAPEPDTDNNTPFGTGPGGQPQFPRPADRPGPRRAAADPSETVDSEYHFMIMPGPFAQTAMLGNLAGQPQVMQDAVAANEMKYVLYGSDTEVDPGNVSTAFARLDELLFQFTNLTSGAVVGIQTYFGTYGGPSFSTYALNPLTIGIAAAGYPTQTNGGASAQFALATPDFGAEQVVTDGALAGHRTFLRAEGSSSVATLSFDMTGTTGFTDVTQQGYVDKLLSAVATPTAPPPPPVPAEVGQTSMALVGIYVHMVIRHPAFLSGAGVFGKPTAVGTAAGVFDDIRPFVSGGAYCGINSCSTV